MNKPERMEDCKHYGYCNASLCPLDIEENIEKDVIWYPNEEICRLRAFSKLPWIKAQRKIVAKGCGSDRYFTHKMLNQGCIIGKRMCGLDPDLEGSPDLKGWFEKHPPISEKKKLASRENIRKGSLEKAA